MLFLSAAATVGEIVALIVVGLIVGALGRLIHPGHDPIGLLATTLIGIASVLVVGLLLRGPLGYLKTFAEPMRIYSLQVGRVVQPSPVMLAAKADDIAARPAMADKPS